MEAVRCGERRSMEAGGWCHKAHLGVLMLEEVKDWYVSSKVVSPRDE